MSRHSIRPVQEQQGCLLVLWTQAILCVLAEGKREDPNNLVHFDEVLKDAASALHFASLLLADRKGLGSGTGLGRVGARATEGKQSYNVCVEGEEEACTEYSEVIGAAGMREFGGGCGVLRLEEVHRAVMWGEELGGVL